VVCREDIERFSAFTRKSAQELLRCQIDPQGCHAEVYRLSPAAFRGKMIQCGHLPDLDRDYPSYYDIQDLTRTIVSSYGGGAYEIRIVDNHGGIQKSIPYSPGVEPRNPYDDEIQPQIPISGEFVPRAEVDQMIENATREREERERLRRLERKIRRLSRKKQDDGPSSLELLVSQQAESSRAMLSMMSENTKSMIAIMTAQNSQKSTMDPIMLELIGMRRDTMADQMGLISTWMRTGMEMAQGKLPGEESEGGGMTEKLLGFAQNVLQQLAMKWQSQPQIKKEEVLLAVREAAAGEARKMLQAGQQPQQLAQPSPPSAGAATGAGSQTPIPPTGTATQEGAAPAAPTDPDEEKAKAIDAAVADQGAKERKLFVNQTLFHLLVDFQTRPEQARFAEYFVAKAPEDLKKKLIDAKGPSEVLEAITPDADEVLLKKVIAAVMVAENQQWLTGQVEAIKESLAEEDEPDEPQSEIIQQ
jgi:hypothetical protein